MDVEQATNTVLVWIALRNADDLRPGATIKTTNLTRAMQFWKKLVRATTNAMFLYPGNWTLLGQSTARDRPQARRCGVVARSIPGSYDERVSRERLADVICVAATGALAAGLWISGRSGAAVDVVIAGVVFQAMVALQRLRARRRLASSGHGLSE